MIRTFSLIALILLSHQVAIAGDTLTRADKIDALYSSQLAFDSRGTPLVTIGVAERADQVELRGDRPLRLLPDGVGGAEVVANNQWTIRLTDGRPARVEHFVVLDRFAPEAVARLREVRARWTARQITTQALEVGSVYGIKGQVLDNRVLLLLSGPFEREAPARQQLERFKAQGWGQRLRVLTRMKRRPSGTLIATDSKTGTTVRASATLWFAAANDNQLIEATAQGSATVGTQRGRYRGSIYVTVDRAGKLAVVNRLPIDRLLEGLVSAEIFPSAPYAALHAQAIAARGNLLAKIGTRNLADPYLTCAWTRCQVYRGAGFEHPRTSRAIRETRGQVLMREGDSNRLVDAVYHANSGGHTENNENVWPGSADPVLRGKLDSPNRQALAKFANGINESNIHDWLAARPDTWTARSSVNRDKFRWQARRSQQQLSSLGVGKVREIRVLSRGVSGRVKSLEISGSRGKRLLSGELRIRRALGNLRSSMFVVTAQSTSSAPDAFYFHGGGWGHGVGLCQSGAIGMAEAKRNAKQILLHYYSRARITQLY
ncbi:MAG: SpoIID/LytB domain-containing protein [Deltaproteobacteria bacterium]|nr:SpoIID/LytB domain-containing protein [Deltaproteobacteria bacterium]